MGAIFSIECIRYCMWFFCICKGGESILVARVWEDVYYAHLYLCLCGGFVFCICF